MIFFVRHEQGTFVKHPHYPRWPMPVNRRRRQLKSLRQKALRSTAPLAQHVMRGGRLLRQPSQRHLPKRDQGPRAACGGAMGGILGGTPNRQSPAPERSFAAASAIAGGPVSALAVNRVQAAFSAPRPLPSHLAILSMASRANQGLAIDTDNHLFFSNDEGRNWQAIPSPWKGRAVSVALTSEVSFGSAAPALKISSHPAANPGSTLSGTITDPSGAVIPGATLIATNSNGVIAGSATTDSHGQYRIDRSGARQLSDKSPGNGFRNAVLRHRGGALTTSGGGRHAARGFGRSDGQPPGITRSPIPRPPAQTRRLKPAVGRTLSRFELTTDDGERWTSIDGQSWARK